LRGHYAEGVTLIALELAITLGLVGGDGRCFHRVGFTTVQGVVANASERIPTVRVVYRIKGRERGGGILACYIEVVLIFHFSHPLHTFAVIFTEKHSNKQQVFTRRMMTNQQPQPPV
jgi:hypothetical protein